MVASHGRESFVLQSVEDEIGSEQVLWVRLEPAGPRGQCCSRRSVRSMGKPVSLWRLGRERFQAGGDSSKITAFAKSACFSMALWPVAFPGRCPCPCSLEDTAAAVTSATPPAHDSESVPSPDLVPGLLQGPR